MEGFVRNKGRNCKRKMHISKYKDINGQRKGLKQKNCSRIKDRTRAVKEDNVRETQKEKSEDLYDVDTEAQIAVSTYSFERDRTGSHFVVELVCKPALEARVKKKL